jgi:integrase
MPAKRKKERIVGAYFNWLLGRRSSEVYFADGRSNRPRLGRHSLGTKNYGEALEALKRLDLLLAVEAGLADRAALRFPLPRLLSLAEGRRLYLEHVNRAQVAGGARPASAKRYRAVLDKFEQFAQRRGVTAWNQVTAVILEGYAAHLEKAGYAYATEYLELTCLKQVLKWLTIAEHLPASCQVCLELPKPQGTKTYCWRIEEVQAIIQFCRQHTGLDWLGDVMTALACTGLRISELASLRWSDIDQALNLVKLTDETTWSRRRRHRNVRGTKSGRSRSFPIHQDLLRVLEKRSRSEDGLIFHGPLGGKLKPDTVRRVLVRDVLTPLAKQFPTPEGDIGFKDGRPHSCRHFFCSVCANSGVPEQVVMAWLGHRDSSMVRHYYHLHDDEAQKQMKRVQLLGETGGAGAAGPTF